MRFVVSGANGFIGSSFVDQIAQSAEHEVIGLVRSAPKYERQLQTDYTIDSLRSLLRTFRPDVYIHAAGSASVGKSIASPEFDRASSVGMIESLSPALQSLDTKPKLLFLSSAAVYGNPVELPVKEGDPLAPISPYGEHRLQCERLIERLSAETGMTTVAARAFSLFGPRQKQLVLWEIAKQALTSDFVTLLGTGLEERDFMHVDEFVSRSLCVLDKAPSGHLAVNIASGESLSIRDLAKKILEILSMKKQVLSENRPQTGNPMHWRAAISRYQTLTGDFRIPNTEADLRTTLKIWKKELS